MGKFGKIAAAAIGILLFLWGGVSAVQHFKRQSEIKAKLEEAIGRDAGYTETILKMEKDSANITFGEFFDLCDKSVEQRTLLIVELRGLYPAVGSTTKDRLIEFLNAENNAVRAKRELYRKQMLLSIAMHSALESARDYPVSAYGWDYYHERVKRADQEIVEAAKELKVSASSFVELYQNALTVEGGVAAAATHSGIRFKTIFKEYGQSNTDEGKKSGEAASQIITQTT